MPKPLAAPCRICGQAIPQRTGVGRIKLYCTDCRASVDRAHGRAWRAKVSTVVNPVRPANCIVCGEGFTSHRGAVHCARCGARERNRHRSTDRQRAIAAGVEYETINRRLVYERDGWICGLCDKKVDPALSAPDHMSASLDHVVPIARGGPHTYANVQLAHWICNSTKGADRGRTQQLRLIA